MSLGGYSTRTSSVGTSRPDPVGASKFKGDTVAEIQPRTATPTQSSGVARHVTSAASSDNEDVSDYGKTPFRRYTDEKTSSDKFGRLSISGRLSYSKPPETPAPQKESYSETIRDRFAVPSTAEKARLDLDERPKFDRDERPERPKFALSRDAEQTQLPEMIRSLVEKSVAESMHEIRNDIQNLHVDLIKQTLAQQVPSGGYSINFVDDAETDIGLHAGRIQKACR